MTARKPQKPPETDYPEISEALKKNHPKNVSRDTIQERPPAWECEPVLTFYHEGGGEAMSNEELARQIQQGERGLILSLWEQVRRYAHDRAYKWFRATNGGGGQTVQDL